jgi:tRNA(adenine34) deaminase
VTPEDALREALAEARSAAAAGEFPYGAVVLSPDGSVVARSGDRVEQEGDLTSHAELLAVRGAARTRGPDLSGHRLVSTVEPCAMCFSAAWTARMSGVWFGLHMAEVRAMRREALDEIVVTASALNGLGRRRLEIVDGLLREECLALWR